MASLAEIDRLQKAIKEMQDRMYHVRAGMEAIEREIDYLSTQEIQLNHNVRYLKKDKVVALASEYGKIKAEIAKIKNRLSFIRIDRENHRTAYTHIDNEIRRLKEELVILVRGPENNVIYGPFRRFDG